INECAGDIANMDVVPLKMRLEQHHCAVVHRTIYKIIDEQIDSHSRRHTKNGSETETDTVAAAEDCFLGLYFSTPIQRDWPQRSIFRTELLLFPDAIAAIGHRHHHALFAAGQL